MKKIIKNTINISIIFLIVISLFFWYFMFKWSSIQTNKNMLELWYLKWKAYKTDNNLKCNNINSNDIEVLNNIFSSSNYNWNMEYWCNLKVLESRYFYKNPINIPSEIWKLKNLKILILDNNNFQGKLPKEIWKLEKLEFLQISQNNITGNIPEDYYFLKNLKSLELSQLKINGSISPKIWNLSKLRELHLHINNLEGSIPESIWILKDLHSLYLHKNNLNWNIPENIGDLKKLTIFYVHDNKLEKNISKKLNHIEIFEY